MRNFKTEGIIIKRRNIGESDKMLTVITKGNGKIQIKASGIRRIPSRRSAHVELLNHTELSLYKGAGFPILTEATTIEPFSAIKDDLSKVSYAYHLCELVDALCPENEEHDNIFFLLKDSLTLLANRDTQDQLSAIIYKFEIDFLSRLGYWNQSEQVSKNFDTRVFIESIIERKLKSYDIFTKLH
jgi:DNA repair protein RecO (recombination protein O)